MIWLAAGAIGFVLTAWAAHKAKKVVTTKKVMLRSPIATEEKKPEDKKSDLANA